MKIQDMRKSGVPVAPAEIRANGATRGHAERGSGRLKAIVWLAILVVMVFTAVKVVPVLMSEYQFQDTMQTAARFASVNRQSPQDIRDALMKEAAKEDLPIKADDIHITNDAGNVQINADYSVTVDLQLYQWTLNFHPSVHNNAI